MDGLEYCCDELRYHVEVRCPEHQDPFDCPDAVIIRTSKGFGLPVRDGGTSCIRIRHCPWCGRSLKRTLTARLGVILRAGLKGRQP